MKKKLLAGLTALLCCFQSLPVLTGFAEDVTLGDVTQDGRIDIMDVILVNKSVFGRETLTDAQIQAADVNKNQKVDTSDSLLMMQYIVKLIEDFDGDSSKLKLSEFVKNLSESVKSESVEGAEADEAFISGQTKFYLELFQNAEKESEGENMLISPYSVVQALGMTANGADGQTKSEMEQVIGSMEIEKLNPYLYTQRINQPNTEKCKLSTANSIWYRNDENRLQVSKDFLQVNADYYGADAFSAPFDNSTVKDINDWVNYRTDSMIPELLDEIGADTVMYLINAVAFDAKWQSPYSEWSVSERDFTTEDGTIQKAQMMYYNEKEPEYQYLEDENAIGFYKNYEGGRYAFAAMLPNEDVSVSDYIAGLTPDSLYETLSNPTMIDVHTVIPKFSYDYDIDLAQNALKSMGMTEAFIPYRADFTKMANGDGLHISRVLHKTHIEVSEGGTKAAAVTAVEVKDTAELYVPEYKEVVLDRPFVYYIVDMETHLPVFMGTVMTVE